MASKGKTNRRQFLKGEAALEALQDVRFGDAGSDTEQMNAARGGERRRDRNYLMQIGRRAMACEFQIFCNPERFPGSVEAASEALDLIDALENQMTVYRDHSEIMRINQHAQHDAYPVEPRLFALLQQCAFWSSATDGAFDITAGPLVKLWGFYTRRGRFPTATEIERVRQRVGSSLLQLNAQQNTIRFAQPEMELNLGSVGKGYALDRCAEILDAAAVSSFLLHGGQSSILARGAGRATDESDPKVPWSVALRHPLRPDRRLAELTLRDRALGTSGSGQQFFYHRGRRYGHVLDPRTGVPADGVLSATVLAPCAAEADALATTFFVLGIDATAAYCENRPELSVVFVLPGNRQGTVAIETIAADDCVQLLTET